MIDTNKTIMQWEVLVTLKRENNKLNQTIRIHYVMLIFRIVLCLLHTYIAYTQIEHE